VVPEVCRSLTVHAAIEEEIYYRRCAPTEDVPAARTA
jgi:hypothetical protein